MTRRNPLGPVFTYDMLATARRWQVYAGRAGFVLVLLIGMACAWVSTEWDYRGSIANPSLAQLAAIGEVFFYALAGIQLSFILLAAPAAAASSICVDRARGTLLHMMVTDLSDAEIVLGRLASRLVPVFGLVACSVPVMALAGLLGGIDFGALVGLFIVSIALAILGCSLALAISVKAAKTHEVLMAVYLATGVALLALPMWWILCDGLKSMIATPPEWFQKLNPYELVFSPYTNPGFVSLADFAIFFAVALVCSAGLVGWSIWRLRRSVIATTGQPADRKRWFSWIAQHWPRLPGPSLDRNPVLWREWHRNRPSRLARWLWRGLYLVTGLMALAGTIDVIIGGIFDQNFPIALAYLIQMFFGLLMVAATSPTVLAEERTRGSLDILLSTPLSTRSIVLAKWWGAYRMIFGLIFLPVYMAIFLAASTPDVPSYAASITNYNAVPINLWDRLLGPTISLADFLASGALIVSIGVALATWIPRVGRAVGTSVVLFVVLGIGWPFVEVLFISEFFNYDHELTEPLLGLSPAIGPFVSLSILGGLTNQPRTWTWISLAVVVLIKLAGAAILLGLTILTFNRCLGRVVASRPADFRPPLDPESRRLKQPEPIPNLVPALLAVNDSPSPRP